MYKASARNKPLLPKHVIHVQPILKMLKHMLEPKRERGFSALAFTQNRLQYVLLLPTRASCRWRCKRLTRSRHCVSYRMLIARDISCPSCRTKDKIIHTRNRWILTNLKSARLHRTAPVEDRTALDRLF
jgi:hypothetical protein